MDKTRQDIIVDNFFKYLNENNINNTKYAKDNNIDRTILSKWKTRKSYPTIEQIYQAANYFDIYVNDLYYTDEEKKHIEVLKDTNYNPIIAKQTIKIKDYRNSFKFFKINIIGLLIINLIIFSFGFILIKEQKYFLIFLFSSFYFGYKLLKGQIKEKTYIVNYLDEIFYYKNVNNILKIRNKIIIKDSILVLNIISLIAISKLKINNIFVNISYLIITIYIIYLIFSKFLTKNSLNKVTDSYFEQYLLSYINLVFANFLFLYMIIFLILNKNINYFLIISNLLIYFISIIYFIKESKNHTKYKLVYKEDNKDLKNLYN